MRGTSGSTKETAAPMKEKQSLAPMERTPVPTKAFAASPKNQCRNLLAFLLASPKLQHLAVPVILLEGLFTEYIHWKCWWPRIGAQNMLQGQYAPMTARPIILLPVPNKLKDIHGTPRMGLHMFAPTQQQHFQYVRLETSYRTNCQTERSKCGKVRNDSETCV